MAGETESELIEQVRRTIAEHDMLEPEAAVLVAVSGGPDSVCLLHVLHELGYSVEVAHFDHQTRDGQSAEDAVFVQELARALDVPCHVMSEPVVRDAARAGRSFEAHARDRRYAFFRKVAQARLCAAVATGHHSGDVAETILMRFLRGAGPHGLAGIPLVRWDGPVRIIRPLLCCRRADIEAWLTQRGLPSRTDHTNREPHYLRNRVRHELMPRLTADYNPRLEEALARLGELAREEHALLDALARAFLQGCGGASGAWSRKTFGEGPVALQRRAVQLAALARGVAWGFEQVEKARKFIIDAPAGHACGLAGGILLRNSRHSVEWTQPTPPAEPVEVPLEAPGDTIALGKRFHARYLDALPTTALAEYCTPRRQVFDAGALGGRLCVRTRRPGDRFAPFGLGGSKKLKDYFIELGLPQRARDETLLLIADGRIAWVVGHAIGADAAVTDQTKQLLEIEVYDAPE